MTEWPVQLEDEDPAIAEQAAGAMMTWLESPEGRPYRRMFKRKVGLVVKRVTSAPGQVGFEGATLVIGVSRKGEFRGMWRYRNGKIEPGDGQDPEQFVKPGDPDSVH